MRRFPLPVLLLLLGLVVLVIAINLRTYATTVDTRNWKTLSNSCSAGTANDSPANVATGVVSGKPFSLKYPEDWTVLQSNNGNCTALLSNALLAPSATLSINSYGFLGAYAFSKKPDDIVY